MTKTAADETDGTRSVVESMYEALLSGDAATLATMFTDDLVVRQPAYLPWGGTYRTPAGAIEVAGKIMEHLDMSQLKVDRVVADGADAIGFLRFPDRTTGDDVMVAEHLTVRDGRIAEACLYYHDTQAVPLS